MSQLALFDHHRSVLEADRGIADQQKPQLPRGITPLSILMEQAVEPVPYVRIG